MFDRSRLRAVWLDQSVRSALFAFLLTRLIVFVIFVMVPHVRFVPSPTAIDINQDISISLDKVIPARTLRPLANWGDGSWYIGTAREGYERVPFSAGYHNWVFFPLWPMVLRAAARVTGGYELTGMGLASIFFFFALVILHKLVIAFGYDAVLADRAIFYLAVFPASYFFSLPHTESLFLFLTVGSFYAAQRERWYAAGALAALAATTRFVGIIMLPALLLLYWQRNRGRPRVRDLGGLLLVPVGPIAFMFYLHRITGDALAFKHAQAAWNRGTGFFLVPLFTYLQHVAEVAPPTGGGNFELLHVAVAITVLICGYKLLRRQDWSLAFYTLASVIVPLTTQSLTSVTRYMMVVFPMYMVLAKAGQSPGADQLIRTVFLVIFSIMTVLFAAHFTIAFT